MLLCGEHAISVDPQLVVPETQGMHTLSRALPDPACASVLLKLGTEQDLV